MNTLRIIKTLLTISTIAFTMTLPSPSCAEWAKVGENEVGETFYLDSERTRSEEGYIYVWSLLDRDKPNHVGYFSTQIFRQIDCKLSRFKVLRYSFHEANMGRGKGRTLTAKQPDWDYPPPNSSGALILKSVCPR